MTSRDPQKVKVVRRDPNVLRAIYLENGWRYRLGYNWPPI